MSTRQPEVEPGILDALGSSTDELLLDRLFTSAPIGLGFVDRTHHYVRVNDALAAMNGRSIAEHLGRTPREILGAPGDRVEALLERVMVSGESLVGLEVALPDGRYLVASYAPVTDAEGVTLGALGVVQDVTDRRRVELDLARALDHSTRLQQVAASLSAALTVDEVAGVVVRASMEVLGAQVGDLALREGQHLEVTRRFGISGRVPGPLSTDADHPIAEAIRTRAAVVASREAWHGRYPGTPPDAAVETFVALPLIFEGHAIGCMGLGIPSERTPDERELALLGAVARQGAQALDRARLYEERAYVAATLQRGLLPARLPMVDGLEVAVSYRPVGDGSQVGGDFYDFVDMGGSWMAAVGDVCGKGAPAAVLSGLVRTTIAAIADRGDRPADILDMVNRALIRHAGASDRADYASAVCAMLARDGDGFTVVIGSAGHPPALVLRADGRLEVVQGPGMLLGVEPDPLVRERPVYLAAGDALVLYTDGITDARVNGDMFGESRLRAVLEQSRAASAAEIVDVVDSAVQAFQAGPARDDAALLVLRAS